MTRSVQQRGGSQKHWHFNDFEVGAVFGRGAFGDVYLAREKETNFVVALKAIQISGNHRNDKTRQKNILREIDLQSRLVHPNILKLYNYFWNDEEIFLILEFAAKGEVKVPEEGFPPVTAARYISQLARALQFCHDMNVIHRDIKPENLLLDIKGNIKLADFGLSVHSPSRTPRREQCGTPRYLAPELVRGHPYWSKVDNWALGVLLYEFLFFVQPFDPWREEEMAAAERGSCLDSDDEFDVRLKENELYVELLRRIVEDDPQFPQEMDDDMAAATDLISKLMEKDPRKRITLKNVLEHRWIRQHTKC